METTTMKIKFLILTPVLMVLPNLMPALAQDSSDAEEEVVVISELSRREVMQFIEEAEDQFYAIFNANNDDEEFDVECYMMLPTGSHIERRVCEPLFMRKARADNVSRARFDTEMLLTDAGLLADQKANFDELQRRMEAMTTSNAQFREIAGILTALRARLRELQN